MPVTLQPTSLKYRNSSEDEWQEASAIKGSDGEGVPAGGQTGQELKKASDNDFDAEWVDDTSVSYLSQSLTDNQKTTARTNISAASAADVAIVQHELTEYNSVKLCDGTQPADNTSSGVTFTWTGNAQCTITGTSSSSAANSNSCATAQNLPTDEIKVGGTYFIHFKSTSTKSRARAEWWIDNPGGFPRQGSQLFTGDTMFTVPAGAASLSLKAHVPANSGAVNETIEIGIYSAPTNLQLYEKSVTDVRVNGTSVTQNGVANVPVAGTNLGAVKVDASYGITANTSGRLATSPAIDSMVKSGTNAYAPIVPARQHQAAFYGFAKAAGDTTQAVSANPVGTYTDGAKAAIQQMLGVPQVATTEEVEEIITEYEEDEDMVFEMTFENLGHGEGRYTSVETTETIMAAYYAGKHVVLHFPEVSDFGVIGECWASIIGANKDDNRLYCSTMLNGEQLTEMIISGDHVLVEIFS